MDNRKHILSETSVSPKIYSSQNLKKYWYAFLSKLGIIGNMFPQGNPATIQAWVNWLNTNFGAGWFALDGFKTILDDKNRTIGIKVKAFWNQNTGEIKMFDARKFL